MTASAGIVQGFLLLPLSWDKGTMGQEIIFAPGQRDNRLSHPLETVVPTPVLSTPKKPEAC